jgi:hypothetical protein
MKLHQNELLFKDAILATSQQLGIREIYVEKDYWVTYALFHIYTNEIGKETIFKGGTSLSKCFQLIERFSEDIDLVIKRNNSDTGNQLKRKLKQISTSVSRELPEIEINGITNKVGMIRKTAHTYPRMFTGNFGQVRDIIIIESSWLGSFEPYTTKSVNSFIYQMLLENNQQSLIETYQLGPFEVTVMDPKRTLCEKIMSLVRFSNTQNPISDLKNKIRHAYDLHLILRDVSMRSFFESSQFDNMLIEVGTDDIESFKNNNDWLKRHPSEALIFSKTEETWLQIKEVYTGSFSELIIGNIPHEYEIMRTLTEVSKRLKTIEWSLPL